MVILFIWDRASAVKGKTSAHMKTSKGKSELYAQKELAIALRGDIELNRLGKEKMQEVINKDGSVENITSSFAETISQKLENLKIKGASKRFSDILLHPLTGQKCTTVYSYSVLSSTQKNLFINPQKLGSLIVILRPITKILLLKHLLTLHLEVN